MDEKEPLMPTMAPKGYDSMAFKSLEDGAKRHQLAKWSLIVGMSILACAVSIYRLLSAPHLVGNVQRNRVLSKKIVGGEAVCNDGSPAVYYISKGPTSTWLLYFQGGGWCHDPLDCDLGSTVNASETRSFAQGTLFGLSATTVWVEYCSMDAWVGNTTVEGIIFRGAVIIDTLLDSLMEQGLSNAALVILAGGSAGGRGVVYNYDRIKHRLGDRTEVVALVDSAVWMSSPTTLDHVHDFYSTNHPLLDPGCDESCLITSNRLDHLDGPLIVFNFLYDYLSIFRDYGYRQENISYEFVQQWRQNVTTYLTALSLRRAWPTLVFGPACFAHDVLYRATLDQFQIGEVHFGDIVRSFLKALQHHTHFPPRLYLDTCNNLLNCGTGCDPGDTSRVPRPEWTRCSGASCSKSASA